MEKGEKNKIFIVEDDPFQAKAYQIKFGNKGFDVDLAVDGDQAMEYLAKNGPPDVVILDLIIPGKSGFEVLQAIRKNPKWTKVPVIILSNLGQQQDIDRGKALGADEYIVKTEGTLDSIAQRVENYIKK